MTLKFSNPTIEFSFALVGFMRCLHELTNSFFVFSMSYAVHLQGIRAHWIRATLRGFAGEVSALMASCAFESSTKKGLEDVRSFIFHNLVMLQDPSQWPESRYASLFEETHVDQLEGVGASHFIHLINTREKHPCRCIYEAQAQVLAVCYSTDGSKLAWAEANEVVVCCASTGFVQMILRGTGWCEQKKSKGTLDVDWYLQTFCSSKVSKLSANFLINSAGPVHSVCFSLDGRVIGSASEDSVKIWNVSDGSCKQTLRHYD
jgi:WD40 repeat protein